MVQILLKRLSLERWDKMNQTRCHWCSDDSLYRTYHDVEWGVPIYDDRLLFEFLILEGMQAGLSWITILKKRDAFRKAFSNFDAEKIALYDQCKINLLLTNADIVRNKLKIHAAVTNANAFLDIKKEWKSFSDFIWHFIGGSPIKNHWKNKHEVPARTDISDKMSNELKKRGFKFVGSTICYAFMQAVGMVNDHTQDCFRYRELNQQ